MFFTYPVIRKFGKELDKMRTKIFSPHAWITQTHLDPCLEKRDNLMFGDNLNHGNCKRSQAAGSTWDPFRSQWSFTALNTCCYDACHIAVLEMRYLALDEGKILLQRSMSSVRWRCLVWGNVARGTGNELLETLES